MKANLESVWNQALYSACRIIIAMAFLGLSVLRANAQNCVPPSTNIVSWWPGNGDALDQAGTNNGILANGATFATGKVGQAFSFNGNAQYVQVKDAPELRFTNAMTVETWIYPTAYNPGPGGASILVKFYATPSYGLSLGPDGRCYFLISTNGANGSSQGGEVIGVSVCPLNAWSHIAATYDGANLRMYFNGSLDTTVPLIGSIFAGTDDLGIGANVAYNGAFFSGLIDEPALYNRALSGVQIAGIYNAGSAGKCLGEAPVIISQPTSESVFVSNSAIFTTTASGDQPFYYQWRINGTNVPGATDSSLMLTNVRLDQSGAYSVVVSNASGSIISSNATLTVLNPSCSPVSAGIVSWWPGESNVIDVIGGNNGDLGSVTFASGKVGQAFSFNGDNQAVRVPDAPGLRFTRAMTAEAWIYPTTVDGNHTIIAKYDAVPGPNQASFSFNIVNSGSVYFLISANGATEAASIYSTNTIPINAWTHVAATFDGAAIRLYINGNPDSVKAYVGSIFPGTQDIGIGGNVGGLASGSAAACFTGLIDEVALYSRALDAVEIKNIYEAGSAGKCQGGPPIITLQPANQTVDISQTATFAVSVNGAFPFSYQWKFNGANISGATSSSLVLTNAQFSQDGVYSVLVINSLGSTNSGNAVLTVLPSDTCAPIVSNLVSWWPAESNAVDIVGGNDGTLQAGATFAAGEAGLAFSFNGSGQCVRVPDAPSLRFTNAMTAEAWIFPTGSGDSSIMVKYDAPGVTGNASYSFSLTSSGRAYLLLNSDGFAASTAAVSSNGVPLKAWTHVAATYDGSAINIYTNGVLDGSTPFTGIIFPGTADLGIGANVGGPTGTAAAPFVGLIDEPSLYSRALTADEIKKIYKAGSAGKCSALPPLITSQPTNVTIFVSQSAAFSVSGTGDAPLLYQWTFNGTNIVGATNMLLALTNVQTNQSGTYAVVISNKNGQITSQTATLTVLIPACTPVPANIVSWWPAENDALDFIGGNNGVLQAGATFASGEVGNAFSFNGAGQCVRIPDAPNLRFTNAMTAEAWIFPTTVDGNLSIMVKYDAGSLPGQDAFSFGLANSGHLYMLLSGNGFDGAALQYSTDPVLANAWTHVAATFDGTNLNLYLNGVLDGTVAYIGSINPGHADLGIGANVGGPPGTAAAPFIGLIDEPSLYNRALTSAELLAIYNAGPSGKCHPVFPPTITQQPVNQSATLGANVTLTVTAAGTPPFAYQWTLNGVNITGATDASLVVTNVQPNLANLYAVTVTNAYGSVTSSNAAILVNPLLQLGSVNASGGLLSVPVYLVAGGNENNLQFSISFNTNLLTFTGAILGTNAQGGFLVVNTNQISSGHAGFTLLLPSDTSFGAGTHEVARINFSTAQFTNTTTTTISFGDQPTLRQLADSQGNLIAANYANATITIPPLSYEGDVAPRTNGNFSITLADWQQIGRFVAGLDSPTNGNEFQRADCAPLLTLGDGYLTVADWVQSFRFATGLDVAPQTGGPVQTLGGGLLNPSLTRFLSFSNPPLQAGQSFQSSVVLNAQGNENVLGFSVSFDPSLLTFTSATTGGDAAGATFLVNSNNAAAGTVGVAIELPSLATFAAGSKQVAKLNFTVAPYATQASLAFTNQPVLEDSADTTALSLPISFQNSSLAVSNSLLVLSGTQSQGNLVISWPAVLAGFALESNTNLSSTNWLPVTSGLVTNGGTVTFTNSLSGPGEFYRLHHP